VLLLLPERALRQVLMFPEAWHAVGRAPLLLESVCLQMVLPERRHATAEGLLLLERVPHPAAGRYCNRGGAPRGATAV